MVKMGSSGLNFFGLDSHDGSGWCWDINADIKGFFVDGIHGTPYIAHGSYGIMTMFLNDRVIPCKNPLEAFPALSVPQTGAKRRRSGRSHFANGAETCATPRFTEAIVPSARYWSTGLGFWDFGEIPMDRKTSP